MSKAVLSPEWYDALLEASKAAMEFNDARARAVRKALGIKGVEEKTMNKLPEEVNGLEVLAVMKSAQDNPTDETQRAQEVRACRMLAIRHCTTTAPYQLRDVEKLTDLLLEAFDMGVKRTEIAVSGEEEG